MFGLIVFLIVGGIGTFLLWLSIEWRLHIKMVKNHTFKHGFGNFKAFLREFDKYNWQGSYMFPTSIFDNEHNSRIHAGVICFNGVGMMMNTPWTWIRVERFVKKYMYNSGIKYKVEWDKKDTVTIRRVK